MQEKRFATPQDVRLRLNETFVKYGNDYFYALQKPDEASTNLSLHDIVSKRQRLTIDANDPALDVSSLPLGYVQYPNWEDSVFISRMPYRRQQQAVHVNSVIVYNVWNGHDYPPSREYLHQEGFLYNLQGVFPEYNGVITSIVKNIDKKIARAFDRSFCVLHKDGKTTLQYNCLTIGSIDLSSKIVTLLPEHNHSVFTMRLAELGVQVAD